MSCLDHYLVGIIPCPLYGKGPHQWKFQPDLLCSPDFELQLDMLLQTFNVKDPVNEWERLKLGIQALSQHFVQFWQKQVSLELHGLCQTLLYQ